MAIRTHYDNLRVTRNAPLEVIRAAYKTLSQKYHPDKNPGDAECVRISQIINDSYQVLSDPQRRKAHDAWIDSMEAAERRPASAKPGPTPAAAPPPAPAPSIEPTFIERFLSKWRPAYLYYFFLIVLAGIGALTNSDKKPPPSPKPYSAAAPTNDPGDWVEVPPRSVPAPTAPKLKPPPYVRSLTAPNGTKWPTTAAYISGVKKLKTNGLSRVIVDNTGNASDVYVKLVSLTGAKSYPVREVFIPAHGKFTVPSISIGQYDVRYRDLDTGALTRSEQFGLTQTEKSDRTEYSEITLTLFKVKDGNMQTFALAEEDF